MTHASLFSGIGGPEIAASMLGWDNAFHCEINDFCRKILEYWYPNSISYENIYETDFKPWRGKVDVLTGGFPCQPFSYAGQRKGHEDDRYLWPQMLRAITEIRPTWVIGENVAGITTMAEQGKISEVGCEESLFGEGDGLYHYRQRQIFTIERVCRDLEGVGYSVQPVIIPACAVGAPHRRDRIFIIANTNDTRLQKKRAEQQTEGNRGSCELDVTDSKNMQLDRSQFGERWNDIRKEVPKLGSGDSKENSIRFATDTTSIGRRKIHKHIQSELTNGEKFISDGRKFYAADSDCEWRGEVRNKSKEERTQTGNVLSGCCGGVYDKRAGLNRWDSFPTISPVHRGNDGLPFDVDHLTIPFSKWRTESLKAYGNAIVPQVMYEIFLAIERIENGENRTN